VPPTTVTHNWLPYVKILVDTYLSLLPDREPNLNIYREFGTRTRPGIPSIPPILTSK